MIIDVEPMSSEDLGRLLELREPDAASRTRELVASAVGNPRAAIRALNDAVVYDREPLAGERGRAALLDAASRLGRPHRMVMAELLERGQASPSDRALQTALGLSRARITQLLRELLEQRLVSGGHRARRRPWPAQNRVPPGEDAGVSHSHVVRVEHDNVFVPRTRWYELAADHLALDELESHASWEERASRSILQDRPVAVTGPPGVGKSSLIAFVCAQLPETHVAFRLPVTGADDPTSVSIMASVALGTALHAI